MTTPSISREFGFTKQALSRHLGLLVRSGLIARKRYGRIDELKLVPQRLDHVTSWVTELQSGWTASLDRLDKVLRDLDD